MAPDWDYITARISHGRLLFEGVGMLPDCDLDAGLKAVLKLLQGQNWEIDPDSPPTAKVRLRRRRSEGLGPRAGLAGETVSRVPNEW